MKWLASICGAPVNDTDSVSHYWRTWRPVGSRGLDWMTSSFRMFRRALAPSLLSISPIKNGRRARSGRC